MQHCQEREKHTLVVLRINLTSTGKLIVTQHRQHAIRPATNQTKVQHMTKAFSHKKVLLQRP